ncbi:MAG TPA: lamin tail domain-containing protein [Longilinea sp.]|nr:lamin tail domain-containing protein [Longilinea sp.]
MPNWKKSIPFLVLNVIVSAITTLVVLVIWSLAHPPASVPVSTAQLATQAVTFNQCDPVNLPADQHPITIQNVIGAGDPQQEEADLLYTGDTALCLNGWKLANDHGDTYSFPSRFQLLANGVTIKVFTAAGSDTPLELHWGSSNAIWQSGGTAKLFDPQGNQRASFKIP